MSDLITLPAAAARLGIHPRTAQRMAKEGRFPGDAAVRIGRLWRVSVPLLERFLNRETA